MNLAGENALGYLKFSTNTAHTGVWWSFFNGQGNKYGINGLRHQFIEEPTSLDDVLGHGKIRAALKPYGMGVTTGEHVNKRIMFKQLLQAEAIDAVQLDACRLTGVYEILSVLLLAAKSDVPGLPYSG